MRKSLFTDGKDNDLLNNSFGQTAENVWLSAASSDVVRATSAVSKVTSVPATPWQSHQLPPEQGRR